MEDSNQIPPLRLVSPALNAEDYGSLKLVHAEAQPQQEHQSDATTDLLDNENGRDRSYSTDDWNDSGTATIGNEILNLVKNIVGSGGFSLPAGMAAFANAPSAILPTMIVIILLGMITAYSFSLLGRICSVTRSTTYQQAWDRSFQSANRNYGSNFQTLVGMVVTAKAIVGCWSYSIIIASTCQPLLSFFLELSKTETLIAIAVLVLLPLCFAENLGSLAGFSFIGQLGTTLSAFTMMLRYFDGSYQQGGRFYDDVKPDLQPSFGEKGWASFFTPQSLILVSILSQGYVAHYNAPKYYYELKDRSFERFNIVVNASFFCAGVTYVTISSLGFLTFGEHSAGFILDNYSNHDRWASASRMGVALAVLFSYPLVFLGAREGWVALMVAHAAPTDAVPNRKLITVVLLATITALAILVPNLTFVLSFSGATLSSCIIYIFPSLMFQALVRNCSSLQMCTSNWKIKESVAMMWMGVGLGICGAVVSVVRTYF